MAGQGDNRETTMDSGNEFAHIQGWGSDLDRSKRPAVPMERTPPRLDVPWEDPPPRQSMNVEVLRSIERPDYSRTFGTRVPPSGVSGMIRRAAFKHSENNLRHWLMLVAADRVNVVEGMAGDLKRSPGKAALVGGGVALAAWWLLRRR